MLTSSYDYRLVSLSVLIAISASYAALDLAGRITASQGKIRLFWLGGGAVAMGQGIWSMHYIGMLAFRLPVEVRYDLPLVLASLLAAIFASGIALFVVTREKFGVTQVVIGSLIMGSGIAAMHYIGMAAMVMAAECSYHFGMVLLSFVITVTVSAAALGIVFHFQKQGCNSFGMKISAAAIMGVAVCAMHYTGMAAVTYSRLDEVPIDALAIGVSTLGGAGISTIALMILSLAVLTSLIDRRFSTQAVELQEQAALLDLAHDSILVCDMDARIVFWNHGAEAKYGWKKEVALGRTVEQLLSTRLPQSREEVMAELLRTGRWEGEITHTHRDGTLLTVMSRWGLQRDPTGTPKRILKINSDITARKRAEEKLRESEQRYRDLFEHAGELIQSVTPEGTFLYVNPAWKATLGYSEADFDSVFVIDIIAPQAREEWKRTRQRVLDGEKIDRVETTFLAKDGRLVQVSGRISCRYDESGLPAYTSGIFRDDTRAREVERLKDEFVSVVSHELRTPLTSIRGSLGLLTSGMSHHLPEKGQRMLNIALSNTDRLVRLINDILDMERIRSGKIPMDKKTVNADDLMRQAVDVVQAMADKANVVLVLMAISMPLLVDPDRIVQTFTNLLSNAIKFSQPGAAVIFSVSEKDGNALFKVQDSGRGIPADKLELVFERFQQVDASDSRVKGGTGLGLPICRTIAEQHGGTVWVESQFGVGSSFFLSLPLPPPKPENADAFPSGAILVILCTNPLSPPARLQAELRSNGFAVQLLDCEHPVPPFYSDEHPAAVVVDLASCRSGGSSIGVAQLREVCERAGIPMIMLMGHDGGSKPDIFKGAINNTVDETSIIRELNKVLSLRGEPANVLLIEDDSDLANVLREMFESDGISIRHATTAKQAMEMTRLKAPTLIVLDVSLSDGDGFEVVNWLRLDNNLRKLTLIVYSAKDLTESEKRKLELGNTQFFTKSRIPPEEFEHLAVGLLREITSRRRAAVAQ